MNILIFGDCHWSTYSSILRKRNKAYSYRLDNLILSINFIEEYAEKNNIDFIVGLGDFFDKEILNSEEITALKEIKWCNKKHYMLVGNHEMGRNDLLYSSTQVFNGSNFEIVSTPLFETYDNKINLLFIPYTLNVPETLDMIKIFNEEHEKNIIFSHNDIAGIQLGQFISKSGFEVKDIEENCDLFVNGHLHNGSKVTDKIINLGNLTGQNFSEDGFKYNHNFMILNTDTLQYELIENPYAVYFYKIDVTDNNYFDFNTLKQRAVVTLKCLEKDSSYYNNILSTYNNILEYRVLIEKEKKGLMETNNDELVTDHILEFKNYVLGNIGSSKIVLEELEEVCK